MVFVAFNLAASFFRHKSGPIFRNNLTSLVHSCLSSTFFLWILSKQGLTGSFDMALAQTARFCTMGYFLYDTVDLVVRLRKYKTAADITMIGHHFGVSSILLLCLHFDIFHQLNILMLVAEPNSIFLHLHALCNRSRWEGGRCHLAVLRCFFVTWYVCRMFVMLTVIPLLMAFELYALLFPAPSSPAFGLPLAQDSHRLVSVVLLLLAFVAIGIIGFGHAPLYRRMKEAYHRVLSNQKSD